MKAANVCDKHNEESVETEVLIEGASVEDSTNVGTIYEAMKASAATDKHNEWYFEDELITEKTSMLLKVCMHK